MTRHKASKKTHREQLRRLWDDHPRIAWTIISLTVLAVCFWLGFAWMSESVDDPSATILDGGMENEIAPYRHPFDGTVLGEPLDELPQVYSVMIDNHEDARPHAGIDHAFLVIEAPVEGGIPRLMAFFHDGQDLGDQAIGPVRSARPYYLDWAQGLNALYAHVGGSPESLERIRKGGIFDLNQYWNGDTFYRSLRRFAPHNVFTTFEQLEEKAQVLRKEGKEPSRMHEPEPWLFKFSSPVTEDVVIGDAHETTPVLSIGFYEPFYTTQWMYDAEQNRYKRYQNNRPHTMVDGGTVVADNVILIRTDVEVIDAVGRRHIRTTGTGEGELFLDGIRQPIQWKKTSPEDRMQFFDADGHALHLNPGITWIEVVGDRQNVTIAGR